MADKDLKITISASSEEALAAFKALQGATESAEKSTTSWAETLTGLNSAWELMGKGVGVLTSVGNGFLDVAKGASDFVGAGGEFGEQLSQFSNVASEFNQDGEDVLRTIQEITGNTADLGASMGIAAKAIAAGLSGPDLETALTYAKRWSEATGASFEEASTIMTRAMQTGSYTILERMGLIVDESTTTGQAIAQMADKLNYMKEPAFNFSDSMTSMDKSMEEYNKRIGKAINDSPTLAKLIDGLAQSLFEFVKGFDYSPFTEWTEVGMQTLEILWDAFGETFDGIADIINAAFGEVGTISAKQFIRSIVDGIFIIAETAGETWNDILGLFRMFNIGDWMGTFVSSITNAFSAIVLAVGKTTAAIMVPIGNAIDRVFGMVQDLITSMPKLAEYIGIDPNDLNSVRELGRGLADIGDTASGMASDIANTGLDFAAKLNLNESAKGLEFDMVDFARKRDKAMSGINAIDYKPAVMNAASISKAARTSFTARDRDLQAAISKASAKTAKKETARSGNQPSRSTSKGKSQTNDVYGPSLEELMSNQSGDRRTIRVVVEGADEFMNSFFEKFLNRAVEDAEAKGILAVRQ